MLYLSDYQQANWLYKLCFCLIFFFIFFPRQSYTYTYLSTYKDLNWFNLIKWYMWKQYIHSGNDNLLYIIHFYIKLRLFTIHTCNNIFNVKSPLNPSFEILHVCLTFLHLTLINEKSCIAWYSLPAFSIETNHNHQCSISILGNKVPH